MQNEYPTPKITHSESFNFHKRLDSLKDEMYLRGLYHLIKKSQYKRCDVNYGYLLLWHDGRLIIQYDLLAVKAIFRPYTQGIGYDLDIYGYENKVEGKCYPIMDKTFYIFMSELLNLSSHSLSTGFINTWQFHNPNIHWGISGVSGC